MKNKSIRIFILSSGSLFLLTAVAKLISATGRGKVFSNLDPVFHVSFRHLLGMAALVELVAALVCFFGKNRVLQVGLIAVLATNFTLYRLGLYWQGYYIICPCWGNLTEALHIPSHIVDTTMKIILAFLLIGSYASLFCLRRQRRKVPSVPLRVKQLIQQSKQPYDAM
jgi:hypothetical protein